MIPLAGIFDGDFVVQLLAVDEKDTVEQLAEKMAEHAVGLRIKQQDKPLEVLFQGERLANNEKIEDVGLTPMDYVLVRYAL